MMKKSEVIAEAAEVIFRLLDIAEIAMPDTFYQTDSRVKAAKLWLKKYAP